MSDARKLAAILVADVVGCSGLAVADEERIPAHPRARNTAFTYKDKERRRQSDRQKLGIFLH